MIVTEFYPGKISMNGHAGYAPAGENDIVCAAVSVLAQSFILSVESLTKDRIKYEIKNGHIEIRYKDLSKNGVLLMRSFYIAMKRIEADYGNQYLKIKVPTGGKRKKGKENEVHDNA